jgi:DNA-binding transcriptional LysR family regulator
MSKSEEKSEKAEEKVIPYQQNRLQQLRGFYYSALFKSFTKAAKRILRGQPSISLQVKALEREFGVIFFERKANGVKLTDEGEILYRLAAPLVVGIDHLKEEFEEEMGRRIVNRIVIAATEGLTLYLLGDAVLQYREQFPKIELKILNRSANEIAGLVSSGEVDLGVAAPFRLPPGIRYEEYFTFDTILLTPNDHPLKKKRRIALKDIVAYPLVLIDESYAIRHQIDLVFHDNHLLYQQVMEVSEWEIVKAYVSRGLGISIVPGFCVFSNSENLSYSPISQQFGHRNYGIMYRRGKPLSKPVKGFIEILRELSSKRKKVGK